jgi:hypothetical protein
MITNSLITYCIVSLAIVSLYIERPKLKLYILSITLFVISLKLFYYKSLIPSIGILMLSFMIYKLKLKLHLLEVLNTNSKLSTVNKNRILKLFTSLIIILWFLIDFSKKSNVFLYGKDITHIKMHLTEILNLFMSDLSLTLGILSVLFVISLTAYNFSLNKDLDEKKDHEHII